MTSQDLTLLLFYLSLSSRPDASATGSLTLSRLRSMVEVETRNFASSLVSKILSAIHRALQNIGSTLVYGAGLLAVEVKPEWIVRGEVLDQFGAFALSIMQCRSNACFRAGRTLGFSNVWHLPSKKKTVVIKAVRDKNPRTPPR